MNHSLEAPALISLKRVSKTYTMGQNQVQALRDLDLEIERGEFVAVMGPSGSGKSTLLNILGCLDRPSVGQYVLNGHDVSQLDDDKLSLVRSRNLGFVFQSFNLLAKLTAHDNIALPAMYSGLPKSGERIRDLLDLVGLTQRQDHRPSQLSGGQQQRVALARSLTNSPPVLLADEPTGNLDSKTGDEIMGLLDKLNQAGLTIVLVTHEEDVARYAKRIIRFRDGLIQSDEKVRNRRRPPDADFARLPVSEIEQYTAARRGVSWREITENLRSAFISLWQNRLRAFLTVLGILIGVGAVIAMVSIGQGAQEQVRSRIEGLGSNLLTIVPGSSNSGGIRDGGSGSSVTLTYDDAAALGGLANIVGVAPELSTRKQVKFGRNNWNTTITGTSPDYIKVNNWNVAEGVFFSEEDNRARRPVAVLGRDTATSLFGDADPLGKTIRIDNFPYQIIGLMEAKGSGGFFSKDDVIFLPLDTAYRKMTGQKNVRSITVQVVDKEHMTGVRDELTSILRTRHKLYTDADNDFQIISQDDILKTAESVTGTMTLLLASIAGISLLVGGIGIMNIMLVTVTERTREIGIRKALGARRLDIMLQFLIEAVVLSLVGGVLGLALGGLAAWLITVLGKTPTVVSLATAAIALAFSFGIGVFFGIYPARKAAVLDPIQALRYD